MNVHILSVVPLVVLLLYICVVSIYQPCYVLYEGCQVYSGGKPKDAEITDGAAHRGNCHGGE